MALEKVLVVDEVDLNACGLQGGHLYNERMVGVIDYKVHAREPDYFM